MSAPFALDFPPGIQRDGTQFDSKGYLDALWCRFRLRRPRKMGGLKAITDALSGPPRRTHCWYSGSQIIAHVGTTNGIQQVIFDTSGNLISVTDRTPASFVGGSAASFTLDAIFDTTSKVVQLVAHAGQNSGYLASNVTSVPLIGQIDAATPLSTFSNPAPSSGTWTQPNVAGGVFCAQPYAFAFDQNGLVQWSAPNLPLYLGVTGGSSGAGQARVSAQKIIAGAPLRGGGSQSPAALLWSLSEVITATYIGGAPIWAFNTISPSSSILSAAGVIEYDGLYFWPGVDRFLVFNGTIAEVPNQQNQDWFFDNITPGFESQVFATKIPRYGEIWWCAPMFGSPVPNHAIIFNLRENCWYDTALPVGSFGSGFFAQGFKRPTFAGQDTDNKYKLWMGETGTDKVDGATAVPIRSFFETSMFGGPKNDPPDDRGLSIDDLEPDIQRTGDMLVYLVGAPNANAPESTGPTVPLKQAPAVPQEQAPMFTPTQNQRLTRLHVESDVLGGTYISGRNLMHAHPSETRRFS